MRPRGPVGRGEWRMMKERGGRREQGGGRERDEEREREVELELDERCKGSISITARRLHLGAGNDRYALPRAMVEILLLVSSCGRRGDAS